MKDSKRFSVYLTTELEGVWDVIIFLNGQKEATQRTNSGASKNEAGDLITLTVTPWL
jgi:hypothetical protein